MAFHCTYIFIYIKKVKTSERFKTLVANKSVFKVGMSLRSIKC